MSNPRWIHWATRSPAAPGSRAASDFDARLAQLRGAGRPLSPTVRADFEGRFGQRFDEVRVHTGATANEAARSIGARAFTLGRDVAFAAGQYRPHDPAGQRLIAHELAHVVHARAHPEARQIVRRQPSDGMTKQQVARDEHLRALARRPLFALDEWSRLKPGEDGVVSYYMMFNYGSAFALAFVNNAKLPPARRRPAVVEVTNYAHSAKSLRARGYRYAGPMATTNIWVNPYGGEIMLLRPPKPASSVTTPAPTPTPAAPPKHITVPADPVAAYGRVVASASNKTLEHNSTPGKVTQYQDGTIEFVGRGGSRPVTYKPIPGRPGEYYLYDAGGNLVEALDEPSEWELDAAAIFGSGAP